MGAEQRRAALRVMTPCQFSVIFVDLQERPSLGETPFRLDISGVLRWFEMEKICGTSHGAFKRRQNQSWRGTDQESRSGKVVRPPTTDLRVTTSCSRERPRGAGHHPFGGHTRRM